MNVCEIISWAMHWHFFRELIEGSCNVNLLPSTFPSEYHRNSCTCFSGWLDVGFHFILPLSLHRFSSSASVSYSPFSSVVAFGFLSRSSDCSTWVNTSSEWTTPIMLTLSDSLKPANYVNTKNCTIPLFHWFIRLRVFLLVGVFSFTPN